MLIIFLYESKFTCSDWPGERLTDDQVDEIIKLTDITIDLEGNVKYEGNVITRIVYGVKVILSIEHYEMLPYLHTT